MVIKLLGNLLKGSTITLLKASDENSFDEIRAFQLVDVFCTSVVLTEGHESVDSYTEGVQVSLEWIVLWSIQLPTFIGLLNYWGYVLRRTSDFSTIFARFEH